MKPSMATLIKGCFPLPQPSPVLTVMAAFNSNPPTAFMTSPLTHIPHDPQTLATPTQRRPDHQTPGTPSQRCSCTEIDPNLFTPSKHMQTLYAGLGSSTSGSFLVSTTVLTSVTPIITPVLEDLPPLPHPDWSLGSNTAENKQSYQYLKEENKLL